MKNTLSIFSLILLSSLTGAQIIDKDQAAKLSCYLVSEWTIFDLRALEKDIGDYQSGNVTFNYCQFADWPEGQLIKKADTFAYIMNETNQFAVPITSGALVPQSKKVMRDEYGNKWIQFTQTSNMDCDGTQPYSFTTEVLCNEGITGKGEAVINRVQTDKCQVYAVISHASGCPAGQIMDFAKFMHDYPWLFGIIMILGGPVVAFYGKRFFPWVIAGIVSVTFLLGALVVCSLLGFMETTVHLGVSVAVAVIVSVLSGWFVMKTVWIAVGVLGLVGGFFLGSMIYTIFLAALGFGALWAMITFSLACAVGGGFLSFKYSKTVVLVMTSVIGSYGFMRGLSYFVGGFPSEAEIFHMLEAKQPMDNLTNFFWIYLALFVCSSVAGMIYQSRHNDEHEMLKNDKNYVDSDDHFAAVVKKINNK